MKSLNIQLPDIPDDPKQNLIWEGELLGVYISGHPITVSGIAYKNFADLSDLGLYSIKPLVLIVSIHEHIAKSGPMAFLEVEDYKGIRAKAIVFPRQYTSMKKMLIVGEIVYIDAKIDTKEETNLIVEKMARWTGKGWEK